jgi:hypothetical protein
MTEATQEQWAALRKPFPPESIHQKEGSNGRMLDYVGHAEVCERLNEVDPTWTWAPAVGADGAPLVRRVGTEEKPVLELWGTFTVLGVTRPAVGTCKADAWSGETSKELCSDIIRNGAMRFGVALDLWKRTGVVPAAPRPQSNNAAPSPAPSNTVAGAVAARAATVDASGGVATAGQVKMINRLRFYTDAKFDDSEFPAKTFEAVGTEYKAPEQMSFRDASRFISILKEAAGEPVNDRPQQQAPAADAPPPDDNTFAGFDTEEPF